MPLWTIPVFFLCITQASQNWECPVMRAANVFSKTCVTGHERGFVLHVFGMFPPIRIPSIKILWNSSSWSLQQGILGSKNATKRSWMTLGMPRHLVKERTLPYASDFRDSQIFSVLECSYTKIIRYDIVICSHIDIYTYSYMVMCSQKKLYVVICSHT